MTLEAVAVDFGRGNFRGGHVAGGGDGPRVLTFTTLFPNPVQPRLGVFVRDRVLDTARHLPTVVVAPVLARPGRRTAAVPPREDHGPLPVLHPRYFTLPGFGRAADGAVLFRQMVPRLRRLQHHFPFDLIDAHYAFPDGAAAMLLARHFRVPYCVTIRGGDIDVLARHRIRRRVIRRTLSGAATVISVSAHLADGAVRMGLVPAARVRVIPNGVDVHRFRPRSRSEARRQLGLPVEGRLLVCAANLTAEKGQHVLVEAMAQLRRTGSTVPQLALIGSDQWGRGSYQERLQGRIDALGLRDRVSLLGSRPQQELPLWYSAADLLVLPTFREGCPNVVREALACGTPAVASRVGGVPELLPSPSLGTLVEPGDPAELATAIGRALEREWDRGAIAAWGGARTWETVGMEMNEILRALARGAHEENI